MTQPKTAPENLPSGGEVADHKHLKGSKFTSSYWLDRVFRSAHTRGGQREIVAGWCTRMQYAGRRRELPLGTNNREEAARKAAKFYITVRSKGWDAALSEFRPDWGARRNVLTVGEYL